MTASSAPAWQVTGRDDLVWAHWDDDQHVLFHRPSGQTHFLNDASARLLTEVLLQPRTALQASTELARAQAAPCDEGYVQAVIATLVRLEELGLLERVRVGT